MRWKEEKKVREEGIKIEEDEKGNGEQKVENKKVKDSREKEEEVKRENKVGDRDSIELLNRKRLLVVFIYIQKSSYVSQFLFLFICLVYWLVIKQLV